MKLRLLQQVFNVRAIPSPPPGVLDLEISENEEFSPDKLRATLERLYITVVSTTSDIKQLNYVLIEIDVALVDCWSSCLCKTRRSSSFLE